MKDKLNILIISIFFIILSAILWGKTGNMMIDFSREIFIPQQMASNQLLIKDIFLIYGFFGYFVNYLVYKIFPNVFSFIFVAHLLSFFISVLFYLIARNFLNPDKSLTITLFFILTSVFSNSTFSLVLPYSYSTLWALFGSMLALYFLIEKNNIGVFISLGLIFISRAEIFLLLFIIVIGFYIYKKERFLKEFFLIFLFPLIFLGYILINKISYSDMNLNLMYLKAMVSSESIKYLYKALGSYIEIKYFIINILYLFGFSLVFLISSKLNNLNKEYIGLTIFTVSTIALNPDNCLNLVWIILIYLLLKLKIKDSSIIILSAFSFTLCAKSIFKISTLSYSNIGYFLMILAIYILLEKIIDKKFLFKIFVIYFVILNAYNFIYFIKNPKFKLPIYDKNIYLDKDNKQRFYNVYSYLEKNLKKDETFLVIPEGQIFNFLLKKPYKFYNSTFTPLDFETFKEENLIHKLKTENPDYIVLYPRNTNDYGKKIICLDYAVDFCTYIDDNYQIENVVDKDVLTVILKRRKNEK